MDKLNVVVAMSGGVDSSVAAAIISQSEYNVIGVHLSLTKNTSYNISGKSHGCCNLKDVYDAKNVAAKLNIPFYVWDFSEAFNKEVIGNFISEYKKGKTPNPCLRCNEKIKFEALLKRATDMGFHKVATGHYAKLTTSDNGNVILSRSLDINKDQSYVLGSLTKSQLKHCLFPLGNILKKDVRIKAEELGLNTYNKPDSKDICFVKSNVREYLESKLEALPGKMQDIEGNTIKEVDNMYGYTVGQRKGLNISSGKKQYIADISTKSQTITIGNARDLDVNCIEIQDMVLNGDLRDGLNKLYVQFRAHGEVVKADVIFDKLNKKAVVKLAEKVFGIASGQRMVLYRGNDVVGAGYIDNKYLR